MEDDAEDEEEENDNVYNILESSNWSTETNRLFPNTSVSLVVETASDTRLENFSRRARTVTYQAFFHLQTPSKSLELWKACWTCYQLRRWHRKSSTLLETNIAPEKWWLEY